VHPADDDRLLGVAAEEADDDLLPHAREVHAADALAGPGLAHVDPERALRVHLAVAVPVELHAHAAELVGVDGLARRADDGRALDAVHARRRRRGLGPPAGRARDRLHGEVRLLVVRAADDDA